MEEEDRIEEGSSNNSLSLRRVGTGSSDRRWVDGSEVHSETPSFPEIRDGDQNSFGNLRRRLTKKPKRADSLDVEAMEIAGAHDHNLKDLSLLGTIGIAFQTLGVVYGDMGTSPLYVFSDVFSKVPIRSEVDVLGALSLVIYTIAVIPLAKYVFIVLKANDNGEGGTFALYSLICRYANVNKLPNQQHVDEQISSFWLKLPTPELKRALSIKESLETKGYMKTLLLLLVLMGTSMIIGDGILTPAMSVMSAMSGLQGRIKGFETNALVMSSIAILVALFSIQRFGTGKVGFLFAPVLALWFFSLGAIGIYNLLKYDITVVRALNPYYIVLFFKKNSKQAWPALGGCVLCITGAEAMFADLGHFSVRSIQIAFTFVVFPCLLLAYMGQAAYLINHPDASALIFYESVPKILFWPVFVIATLAAMIASQAMISATFSCVKQAMALGCFPRLKIIHTSKKRMGQIYIPVINWFLMIMCILVVSIFRSTDHIANAYGIAEVGVMMVSTVLVTLVMLLIWQTNLFLALCFPLILGSVESIYLLAVLTKILEGGWVPLVFATCFLTVMYIWNYGSVLKYQSEVRESISMDFMRELGPSLGTIRIPGIGLLYNELDQGIPSIFGQCIARYGYKDVRKEDSRVFEELLVECLEKFLRCEALEDALESTLNDFDPAKRSEPDQELDTYVLSSSSVGLSMEEDPALEYELATLREATESGLTYLLAHGDVKAKKSSIFVKKLVINYFYAFLRRNCRAGAANLTVPHVNILQAGMTYKV
ncbi:hypothetical protein AALP_AA2G044000 [Arabis alpina]|uniref:Potassium transporter n=1 Tax=Arabis alpina TaxID=50452 RepID=A0A087HFA9_ARAAL|nr:hypothetical protein AALP_AA2G044000 [Arabis alpina]